MKTIADNIYHVYNQGNNRQCIFFDKEDYLIFLKKYQELVAANCETLCYCLMPNHFHFLIYATQLSEKEKKLGSIIIQNLSDGFRRLLSIYAHELNERRGAVGSLFRQKTKAKLIEGDYEGSSRGYAEKCFYYIHQNPVEANLVKNISDWEFSSVGEYLGLRKGTLSNQDLTFRLFDWSKDDRNFLNNRVEISAKSEALFFEEGKFKSDQGQTA